MRKKEFEICEKRDGVVLFRIFGIKEIVSCKMNANGELVFEPKLLANGRIGGGIHLSKALKQKIMRAVYYALTDKNYHRPLSSWDDDPPRCVKMSWRKKNKNGQGQLVLKS